MTTSRFLSFCLWAIVLLLIVPLYFHMAWDDPVDYAQGGMGARDFKAYYVAAKLLERGEDVYDPGLQKKETAALGLPPDDTLYIYPTIFALSIMPLARLPLTDAARMWNLINILLIGASIFVITRTFELDHYLGRHFPWFVILFAISYPTTLSLRAGQANFLLLFSFSLVLYATLQKLPHIAGIALVVPLLTKIFAGGFLVWYVWRKQYRTVIYCVVAACGVLIASNFVLFLMNRNSTSDFEYFASVLPKLAASTANVNAQSLRTLKGFDVSTAWVLLGNYSVNGFFSRLDLAPNISHLLTILSSGVILLLTFARVPRIDRKMTIEIGFGGVLAALLLISTITWESTLVLLLIPFSALLKAWVLQNHPQRLTIILIASFLSLNAGRLWSVFDTGILVTAPWLISLPFIGAVLVWWACVSYSQIAIIERE